MSNSVLKQLVESGALNSIELQKAAKRITEQFQQMSLALKPMMSRIAGALNQMPKSVKVLSNIGWYITEEFDPATINEYAAKCIAGHENEVDALMIRYFDDRWMHLTAEIENQYRHRARVLQSAFTAHANGNYYLSVPVLFAQSEGIFREVTGVDKFYVSAKTSKWAKFVQSGSIMSIMVEPMRNDGVVRRSFDKQSIPIGINRHHVMHGLSFNYGEDRINSYKAASLLCYVALVVPEVKKHIEKHATGKSGKLNKAK